MDIKWEFEDFKQFEKALLDATFGAEIKEATEEVGKTALNAIKRTTPVKTGKLRAGWTGNDCKAQRTSNGYTSEMSNTVSYAAHVNDGHRVRNRSDGAYYKVKHRIKVPIASEWQANTSDWYVFGHFFVEKGLKSTREKMKPILNRHFNEWWNKKFK